MKLRSLAAAGNAAALVLLVLFVAHGRLLLEEASGRSAGRRDGRPAARKVLVVLIDGLRVDAVPGLPHLSRFEGKGTARVESPVPSTVAGIRALVEGAVPPPASFLQDFAAPVSPDGGIFAAVRGAGLTTFAAGSRLWTDLYSPWLAGGMNVDTVRSADERVLQAALDALDRYDFVVAHFGAPDEAAHEHGGNSREYRQVLAWCDAALARLLARAGPGVAVLVTSDHGVTGRGGHAGAEPSVIEAPVMVHGPGMPRGYLGTIRQRDLHRLILRPLGIAIERPERQEPRDPWALPILGLALLGGWALWSAAAAQAEPRRAAFVLNGTLWAGIALGAAGELMAATGAALVALLLWLRPVPAGAAGLCLLAIAAGAGFGGLRILDGLRSLRESPLPPSWIALAAACALGIGAGWALRRLPPLACGVGAAVAPVILARAFLGETASLSTVDVRLAYHVADGLLGLPAAVLAAVLWQALPFLCVLLGVAPELARLPSATGAFASGLAAALAGQALPAALAMGSGELAAVSLGIGLSARLVGELSYLFLGSALLMRLAGRPRRPAATPL